MKKTLSAVLLGSLFCLAGHQASASITSKWSVDSYKSFDKGEAENAFVTSLGEVRPGYGTSQVELEFGTAWASEKAADGTVYIGSDDKATIYKVKGEKVSKLASIPDTVAVVSLVLDGNSLYAGTMPDGQVWHVDTSSGKTKKLATLPKAETVWALTKAGDSLYAGTGPEGLLYEVSTKTGKASVAFDTEDKRIMSLLHTGDDAIWLGTSDKALLFRYDRKTKRTRAVADFAGNEVSALAEWQGEVIAAANDFAPGKAAGMSSKEAVDKAAKKESKGQKPEMPSKGSKPGADGADNASVKPLAKSVRKGKGALYKVRGDGQLTQIHALTASYFTDVAVNGKGQIFAGAADKGRIYLVEAGDRVSTAIDVDQRYVADIHIGDDDSLSFTTGDSSALVRAQSSATKAAVYTSDVFDAKTPAKFGGFSWHGSGSLTFETRSGNTEEPGIGWSAWQAPSKATKTVGNVVRAAVQSPTGRYIQYRVTLGSKDAVLKKTTLFYLPSNRPTLIRNIVVGQKSSQGLITAKTPKPHSPIVNLDWDVKNDDGDKTEYTLEVRRDGDVLWRPITDGNEPLAKSEYKWNTETYADGYYRLRVTANDRLANSGRRALTTSKTTPLFVVDNERPKISGVSIKYPAVSARATDGLSTITEAAYSVDDGPWQLAGTKDSIFDSQSELLDIVLPAGLAAGAHTLSIRVIDEAGNIGSATANFRTK